ncbi:hypothetical protein SH449x_004178 [Pirellulaceae bacterium SH449]
MLKKILLLTTLIVTVCYYSPTSQAQYGGVQLRIGSYGPSSQFGGFGNNYYNGFNYGYGNSYRYGNGNQFGYGNYRQPGAVYLNRGNYGNFRYSSYPSMSYGYGMPRNFSSPSRRYFDRRYR